MTEVTERTQAIEAAYMFYVAGMPHADHEIEIDTENPKVENGVNGDVWVQAWLRVSKRALAGIEFNDDSNGDDDSDVVYL